MVAHPRSDVLPPDLIHKKDCHAHPETSFSIIAKPIRRRRRRRRENGGILPLVIPGLLAVGKAAALGGAGAAGGYVIKKATEAADRRRRQRGGVLPLVAAGVGALLGGVAAVTRNNARIRASHRKRYDDMVARTRAEDARRGDDSAIVYTHIPPYKPPRYKGQILLEKLKRKLRGRR